MLVSIFVGGVRVFVYCMYLAVIAYDLIIGGGGFFFS